MKKIFLYVFTLLAIATYSHPVSSASEEEGQWTKSFRLGNGANITHAPDGVQLITDGAHLSGGKGIKLSAGVNIGGIVPKQSVNLSVDMTQAEFTREVRKLGSIVGDKKAKGRPPAAARATREEKREQRLLRKQETQEKRKLRREGSQSKLVERKDARASKRNPCLALIKETLALEEIREQRKEKRALRKQELQDQKTARREAKQLAPAGQKNAAREEKRAARKAQSAARVGAVPKGKKARKAVRKQEQKTTRREAKQLAPGKGKAAKKVRKEEKAARKAQSIAGKKALRRQQQQEKKKLRREASQSKLAARTEARKRNPSLARILDILDSEE